MNANSSAKFFMANWYNLRQNKYLVLLNQLKELGATKDNPIKFNWKEQFAPCIVGECFGEDIADTYVKSIYQRSACSFVRRFSYLHRWSPAVR